MSSKDLPPIVFKRSADEMPNQPITIRQEPTTASQKADLFIADTIGLIKKYKWLWIILILIPCILAFVYLIASQPTWKQAIVAFFEGMWGIIVWISGFIIPYFWIALLLIFIGYKPIKKLLSKEKISFDEFGGENEEIMTMRRGGDETILYRDRGNFLETIFRGKEKIHITNSTFDMLKSVGNKKQLFFEDEAHDILRVPIMPQTELPDQEKFKLMPDGRKTFNGLFLLDHEDIEEYMLKSMIPGVNAELLYSTLQRNLIGLNKELQILKPISMMNLKENLSIIRYLK